MKSFSDSIYSAMQGNEAFLKENADNAFTESIELANDAIDYSRTLAQKDIGNRFNMERAFYFYTYHVLMPTSYSISINLLTGNLPGCFRDLRLLVEFLAKSYLADTRHSDGFFRDRLRALHEEKMNKNRRKREVDFVKEFDDVMNLNGAVVGQWKKFSNEIHARQYAERIVDNIVEKDNVPGYALVFPMPYSKKDIPELDELGKDIEEFAVILKTAFNRYTF